MTQSRIAIPADRHRALGSRARAVRVACAVALLVVSGACGDDSAVDAGKAHVVATDENTSSTVGATAGATGGTAGTGTTAAKVPGDARLAAVLLTADDLPGGWTKVPVADTGDGDSCLDALGAPGRPFDTSAAPTVTFGAGKIGPFLAASVDDRPAGVVLPAVNEILVACDGSKSAQGFTTTVEPASIAGLPEDSLAVHATDKNDDGSGVRYTIAFAGTDAATVMVFAVTPLGEIDETVVAAAVNAMYRRLPGS